MSLASQSIKTAEMLPGIPRLGAIPGLQNYSLAEAAELLRCFPRFLEDNLKELPHQKIGAAVAFDADELLEIKNLFRVRPAGAGTALRDAPPLALADIAPSRRRQRV
ncbi:hypothetical protein [Streptomyces sp. ITFR-6]|uniref:hypothetical protein n=1 Tax=Streptomyces sp. ITFR-6 TaxID=3075197 RepID=UPI0028893C48|nr:hypothetical protein [Streptomyces sp. ITFR-6]WNI31449.1 hypothetical protein RLT59_23665 [Streptomyces sp. ITFR-6]